MKVYIVGDLIEKKAVVANSISEAVELYIQASVVHKSMSSHQLTITEYEMISKNGGTN